MHPVVDIIPIVLIGLFILLLLARQHKELSG